MAHERRVSAQAGSGKRNTADKGCRQGVELILSILSGLAVLAIIGFLVVEGVTTSGGKPELGLRVAETYETAAGSAVVLEVRNEGEATAASVEVGGSADGAAWQQVTLDYAPAKSRREVTLLLPAGTPAEGMSFSILGYVKP